MDRTGSMGFRGIHPVSGFLYFACWIVILTLGFHILISAVGLLLSLILAWVLGLQRELARNAKWFGLAFVLMTLINPLMNHRGLHILFYFMDQPITLEAVVYGLHMAFMIVGALVVFLSFNEVIHPQRFLYLFSGLAPKAALMMMVAMRFVPLLRRRLQDIALVQQTRGVSLRTGRWIDRLKGLMQQVQILITWSLEEAVQTADSLSARGYGLGKRSTYHPYRLHWRDIAFVVVCGIGFATCMYMWLRGYGRMDMFESHSYSLGWDRMDSLVLGVIILYAAIPIGMEGREHLWWHKLKSDS